MKNLLPPVVFPSIRHISVLFIPDIWRDKQYAVPLQTSFKKMKAPTLHIVASNFFGGVDNMKTGRNDEKVTRRALPIGGMVCNG